MAAPELFMLSALVVGGAASLLVVTARNVVHAALFLVVALVSVAASFLWLGAEFLAWAQVLVYVGAVIVLILFGLMLTRAPIGPMAQHNENRKLAAIVAVALFALLTGLNVASFGGETIELHTTGAGQLGEVLYLQWAFPFVVLGFLLTVSLIGALVLARREEGEGPLPDTSPHEEVAAGRESAPTDATPIPGGPAPGREIGSR
jgi:NADH-quinone oxidoreductase subunit J